MANISTGNGTMILEGNWTQEALDAFKPVAQAWEFYGEFGVRYADYLKQNSKTGEYTADIYVVGKWACYSMIESLDDWTRDWIKDKPWEKKNNKPKHPLNMEQYDLLVKLMCDNNLKIIFEYLADAGGFGYGQHREKCELMSDGKMLCCSKPEISDISWDDLDDSALESVINFFQLFTSTTPKAKIKKWVQENIEPTTSISEYMPSDFNSEEDEPRDVIDEIIQTDCDGFVEEVLPLFLNEFTPDPQVWEVFNEVYEEINGEEFEFNNDDEFNDEDED